MVDACGMERRVEFGETRWMVRNPWFAWVPALFVVMYTSGYGALMLRGVSTDTDFVLWLLAGLALPAVLCTWRLRTEVVEEAGERTLEVSLPPVSWLRWRVALGEIEQAEVVELGDKARTGFGLRRTEHGWNWQSYGEHGVRVQAKGQAPRVIGTGRPEDLVVALGWFGVGAGTVGEPAQAA